MIIYIAQGFILIGYLIFFISRFKKNKKSMLITDTISRLCSIVGYCLFNSINSIEHTIYGIIRNIVGQTLISKKKSYKILWFSIMLVTLLIMYGLSFNGISTIIFMLSGLINLSATIFAEEQGIRLGTVFAAICNILAFLIIGSYASVMGETLCGIIGFLSFRKGRKKKMRLPSEYKGKTLKLKKNSSTFLDIQEENKTSNIKDESTSVIIEDWAENVLKKETFYTQNKLYGHLDKSYLAVIVGLDELDMDL